MSTKSKAAVAVVAPVVTSAASVPLKAPRYAPLGLVSNPAAVITVLAPNPKLPNSKAHHKYSLFVSGQTIAQYTQAIINAGYKSVKAKNQVRWDLAHGFITLTAPAA
jgi:hypothetical protein